MSKLKKVSKKPSKKLTFKKKVVKKTKKLSSKDKKIKELEKEIKQLNLKLANKPIVGDIKLSTPSEFRNEPVSFSVSEQKEILVNRAKCKKCNEIITSQTGHDFVWCKCGAIAVDGGRNYLKRVGERKDIEEMSLYADSPFVELREAVCRGGRGKNGDEELKWVPISKMSDAWLEACIVYNVERGMSDAGATKLYRQEQAYRKENNIVIAE